MKKDKKLPLAERKYQEKKTKIETTINSIYKEAEKLTAQREQAIVQLELFSNSLINLTKEAFYKDKPVESEIILKLVQNKKRLTDLIKRLADDSIKKEFNKMSSEIEKHQKKLDKLEKSLKNQGQKLERKLLDLYQQLNKLNFHYYLQKKKKIKPLYFYLKEAQEKILSELTNLEKEIQTCDKILNHPQRPELLFKWW